jgi:hypothetical protein
MEPSETSIGDELIPARLAASVSVDLPLGIPVEDAVKRLTLAIERAASVEGGEGSTNRHLVGEVSGEVVRLSVADSQWARGRVGWRIEFEGRLGQGALRGVVAIVDTNHVRRLLWLFRVGALVPLVFGIASAMSQGNFGPPQFGVLLVGLAIAVSTFIAIPLLEASIERAAADDARVLTNYIRSQLA